MARPGISPSCRECGGNRPRCCQYCRPCAKSRRQRHEKLAGRIRKLARYGLTPETYDALVIAQGNRCAICQRSSPGGRWSSWYVDHNHINGVVRGLLCGSCNTALGLLQDDPDVLSAAINYLKGNI